MDVRTANCHRESEQKLGTSPGPPNGTLSTVTVTVGVSVRLAGRPRFPPKEKGGGGEGCGVGRAKAGLGMGGGQGTKRLLHDPRGDGLTWGVLRSHVPPRHGSGQAGVVPSIV